jgi:hypothetical protein
VARLHVTRDPSTGHLTMNDVGSGAFAVSQPRACAPIASEADGEANSVTGAMVQLRTKFRVGKILRRCDATSASAFRFQSKGTSNDRDTRHLTRESALTGNRDGKKDVPSLPINPLEPWEALLEDLNAGSKYGALCYTPDFLRGVASTLSVCSRNHEDGVALALLGFIGIKSASDRLLVSVSDAAPNAPERGASAYLVHNHRFAGAFVDGSETSAEARRAHFRDRNVPDAKAFFSSSDQDSTVSGAAAVVRGELQPSTIGAEIREALEALEGASEADATDATEEEEKRRIGKRKTRRVEVDLLTLDVARDGLYLAQPALETVSPRLVAVSYDSAFGPELALASKPGSGFGGRKAFEEEEEEEGSSSSSTKTEAASSSSSSRASYRREGSAFGRPSPGLSAEEEESDAALQISASLSAYLRVLERWGFHFVGCEAAGETAFFLRSDVIETAHRAGRGSVHVTTPSDSGCFSARAPRMAMKKWPRIQESYKAKEQTFDVIDEAWLAAHAPGPPWRSDDAFLVGGAFAEEL